MAASSKKQWKVQPGMGEAVEVTATRMETDEAGLKITFYDGDDMVAAFRGYTSVYPA